MQGAAFSVQGAEMREAGSRSHGAEERVLELETENARLKSLVGELLVANQLLREKTGV
jgi:hypothetical protein